MGLRGTARSERVAAQEAAVWREYLPLLLLGYWGRVRIAEMVAAALGVLPSYVLHVVGITKPDGCYGRRDP